jgi:hypothetical protein
VGQLSLHIQKSNTAEDAREENQAKHKKEDVENVEPMDDAHKSNRSLKSVRGREPVRLCEALPEKRLDQSVPFRENLVTNHALV